MEENRGKKKFKKVRKVIISKSRSFLIHVCLSYDQTYFIKLITFAPRKYCKHKRKN